VLCSRLYFPNLFMVMRFEVFTAVKFQDKVFCIVILCNVVVGYQYSEGLYCLHLQGEPKTLVSYCHTIQHHKPEDLNFNCS